MRGVVAHPPLLALLLLVPSPGGPLPRPGPQPTCSPNRGVPHTVPYQLEVRRQQGNARLAEAVHKRHSHHATCGPQHGTGVTVHRGPQHGIGVTVHCGPTRGLGLGHLSLVAVHTYERQTAYLFDVSSVQAYTTAMALQATTSSHSPSSAIACYIHTWPCRLKPPAHTALMPLQATYSHGPAGYNLQPLTALIPPQVTYNHVMALLATAPSHSPPSCHCM